AGGDLALPGPRPRAEGRAREPRVRRPSRYARRARDPRLRRPRHGLAAPGAGDGGGERVKPPVFLTGATGFLGMEVLARLLEAGDREVVALVRARDDQ